MITATESQAFTVQVGTFTDVNPAALPTGFVASINWGDGTSPSSGLIAKQPSGAFTVTGSHTYAEESGTGTPYAITVTVTNVDGTAPTTITGLATATVADAPLHSQGSPINGMEGIGLSPTFSTVATFTDTDPNGTVSDYTAMINWGDGTPSTVGTIMQTGMSPNGSTFQVSAPHSYPEEGTYQTVVTITDVGGSQTAATGNAVIADAPLTASSTQPAVDVTESIPFSGAVGMFTDGNPGGTVSDFTATIDWGDGTPNSAGTISQPGGPGNAFVVSGSHTYGVGIDGTIVHDPILVFVHDVGGSALTIANTANIAYEPLPKVTDLTFNRVGGQIQATFQDFGVPFTGTPLLNQATLADANNYRFTKYNQHGPAAYKITSIIVSPPNASGGSGGDADDQRRQIPARRTLFPGYPIGQPKGPDRNSGHLRQRARRGVLRFLPLGQQRSRRRLHRRTRRGSPHDLRTPDCGRHCIARRPPGQRTVKHDDPDVQPQQGVCGGAHRRHTQAIEHRQELIAARTAHRAGRGEQTLGLGARRR